MVIASWCRNSVLVLGSLLVNFARAEGSESRSPASIDPFPAHTEESEKSEKGHYHLFNPVPAEQRREFDADRPGFTDSPRTIDAGHFQIEFETFSYSQERYTEDTEGSSATTTVQKHNYGSTSLNLGLSQNLELQFRFDGYLHQVTTDSQGRHSLTEGFGNTGLRLKWNLMGNDSGNVAIALIPFMRFATGSRGIAAQHSEGGFSVPFAFNLPSHWFLGFTPVWTRKANEVGEGSHHEWVNSALVAHSLFTNDLKAFAQVQSTLAERSFPAMTAGFGFAYQLSSNVMADVEPNFGVNHAPTQFSLVTGLAIRIGK